MWVKTDVDTNWPNGETTNHNDKKPEFRDVCTGATVDPSKLTLQEKMNFSLLEAWMHGR